MPSMKERREALVKEMAGLAASVKSGDEAAISRVDAIASDIEALDADIAAAETKAAKLNNFAKSNGGHNMSETKTLGEVLADSIKAAGIARGEKASFVTPEVKAAGDTVTTPAGLQGTLSNTVYFPGERTLTVRSLLTNETTNAPAVTYFQAAATEGAPAGTAEGGKKPSFHISATPTTVSLKKVAGVMKESDEVLEDYPRLVSTINTRGVYELNLAIEDALVNGDGQGANLQGLLNTQGIGSVEYKAANPTPADKAEAVYAAITKVQTDSGYAADGIVINPTDYQAIRLYKDANGQYFGGGYFSGEYGQNYVAQPALWGVKTVVTTAVPAGTILVGAFRAGASVLSKGGTRVDTGYDGEDFSSNRVTFRIEERLALAVYVPAAFVAVKQAAADGK